MRNMNNEQGRSMIEMLGVLAIVGVLSVAGIQGYSKAMAKYKTNQLMDEVSTIAANVKTLFASQGQYTDLGTGAGKATTTTGEGGSAADVAVQLGLIPDNMTRTAQILNAMNGLTIVSSAESGKAFTIEMQGITDEACIALVTSDWGGTSGYKGLTANSVASGADTESSAKPTATAEARFNYAATNCGKSGSVDNNTIVWTFY